MHKRKDPDLVINTFVKFNKKNPDTQLVFVGPDIAKNSQPNTVFTGYISNQKLSHLYQDTEALIFNSLCEGFGLPLIEAFSNNTPTICSNIPIFQEISNNSSLFYTTSNQLLNNLSNIYKNKTLKQQLTSNGKIIANKYSWKTSALQTLQIYQKVINE